MFGIITRHKSHHWLTDVNRTEYNEIQCCTIVPAARHLSEHNLHDGFPPRLVDYIPSTFVLFAIAFLRNNLQTAWRKPFLTKLTGL